MPKRRVINPQPHLDRILSHLSQFGPVTAWELLRYLDISQASLSRLMGRLQGKVLRIGKGRQTRYACYRLGDWGVPQVPIVLINEQGRPTRVATLHPVAPRGFYLESSTHFLMTRYYDSWPYFLEDLRPSGFLGRLIPRLYPELNLPDDITAWSDDQCLVYLTRYGWDLIGNIMVGEKSFEEWGTWAKGQMAVAETDCSKTYPEYAERVLSQGIPGSSAAGEQPKFLALLRGKTELRSVLVKFSPPLSPNVDTISRRVADLLICEHIVHDVLNAHRKISLKSRLMSGRNRLFLEVERFDRTHTGGRRGVISLRALDLEFVGQLKSWSESAEALFRQGTIDAASYQSVVWLEVFAKLIGNTDRHHGNISFFCNGEKINGLAPVYDMVPMLYAPQQNQLIERPFDPAPPKSVEIAVWNDALSAAINFWSRVQGRSEISKEFKRRTSGNESLLISRRLP